MLISHTYCVCLFAKDLVASSRKGILLLYQSGNMPSLRRIQHGEARIATNAHNYLRIEGTEQAPGLSKRSSEF